MIDFWRRFREKLTEKLSFSREKIKTTNKKWLIFSIIAAVFVVSGLAAGLVGAFELKYHDEFFPGSRLGGFSLEGLTPAEAEELLNKTTSRLEKRGIEIKYENQKTLVVNPIVKGLTDPDLSREIWSFQNQKTIKKIFRYGRRGNFQENLQNQVKLLFSSRQFPATFQLNEQLLQEQLQESFSEFENYHQNAQPEITEENQKISITIKEEKIGTVIDYQKAIEEFKKNLAELTNRPIILKQKISRPEITKAEAEKKENILRQALATTTPRLYHQNNSWKIPRQKYLEMLGFQKQGKEIKLGLNKKLFQNWIEKEIVPEIEIAARDAKLNFQEGKVVEFITHRDGRRLEIETTRQAVNQTLLTENLEIPLAVETIKPQIITEEVNDMGIKEIIGTGESDFSGSPPNRRHNIRTGAAKLNGVLIKPEEEFSLVKTLGPVNAASGYLPELVIKENKTIPEYGGGLCQIGTTIFRAAIFSGLPITERRPHSYTVSYYFEDGKPGMDATIYIPHPDVRFINDTGNYILIQSRIKDNNLYFDFWGAKDGRQIEITPIKTWGWTAPPPTKYIETLELAPGQKKCTESSHYGVRASFDYLVTKPGQEPEETTFYSNYQPWQAVCLIGVEELSEKNASSTPEETPQ